MVLDSQAALHRALESARNHTVVLTLSDGGDLLSAEGMAQGLCFFGRGVVFSFAS